MQGIESDMPWLLWDVSYHSRYSVGNYLYEDCAHTGFFMQKDCRSTWYLPFTDRNSKKNYVNVKKDWGRQCVSPVSAELEGGNSVKVAPKTITYVSNRKAPSLNEPLIHIRAVKRTTVYVFNYIKKINNKGQKMIKISIWGMCISGAMHSLWRISVWNITWTQFESMKRANSYAMKQQDLLVFLSQ